MTASKQATVEVLTAEVRVLMVGSRQITLSVYAQLDKVPPHLMVPFGRVAVKSSGWHADRYGGNEHEQIDIVGAHRETGQLCAGWLRHWPSARYPRSDYSAPVYYRDPVGWLPSAQSRQR